MKKSLWFVCFLSVAMVTFGCSKNGSGSGSSSRLSMTMPGSLGNGAFSGHACFAVDINAADIEKVSPGECDSDYGLFSGLVAPGGSVEIEAPFGDARTIDIYYIISDQPCSTFDPAKGLGKEFGSNKVWRISRTENINFDQPQVTVYAQIEWPASSNSLKTLEGTPATCDSADPTINIMAIKQASVVQGAKVSQFPNGAKINLRIVDKSIPATLPSDFSGKLQPVRLGEQ